MRATAPMTLIVVLIATGSSTQLKAASEVSLRTSIATTAKAFASSQSATDSAATANWTRLAKLPRNRRIVVRTRDGQAVRATFVEADDVSLTALSGTIRTSFARAEVSEVASDPKGSRGGAYVGGLLGCLLGGALGTGLTRRCSPNCGEGNPAVGGLLCGGMAVGFGLAGYYGVQEPPAIFYRAP